MSEIYENQKTAMEAIADTMAKSQHTDTRVGQDVDYDFISLNKDI
jgi:hypothetical protein